MLIDDRLPPYEPSELPPWEPDLRLWAWILAALVAGAGAAVTGGFVAFLLLCVAVACGCSAATHALPSGDGLREHRQ